MSIDNDIRRQCGWSELGSRLRCNGGCPGELCAARDAAGAKRGYRDRVDRELALQAGRRRGRASNGARGCLGLEKSTASAVGHTKLRRVVAGATHRRDRKPRFPTLGIAFDRRRTAYLGTGGSSTRTNASGTTPRSSLSVQGGFLGRAPRRLMLRRGLLKTFEESRELPGSQGVLKFPKGLRFNLPDSLAGHVEELADVLQGIGIARPEAVSQPDDLALPAGKRA